MKNKPHDDNIQHGIDNDPENDAEKGAVLGGVGGAAVGGVAGATAGPVGAVIGAVAGAAAGAVGSGAAVAAVDKVDNDNTITGLGDGVTRRNNEHDTMPDADATADTNYGHVANPEGVGNDVPGVQTGGVTTRGEDTRGITEKAADAVTGDDIDDKTGGRVL